MECVGTLSWSGVTWGGAARTLGAKKVNARDAGAPAVRRTLGVNDRGRTQPAARAEVRPLEQDWSKIVHRCMDGDSGAWAEMVRTHQKRVFGLCYRFTGNAADAEDLTQDVFLKIYSNLGSFDATRGSLPVWITTMTRNLLVDNFRRTRNQRAMGSLDEGWDQTEELRPHLSVADRLADAGPSPHDSAARQELKNMVQMALMKVSVELREAVILR